MSLYNRPLSAVLYCNHSYQFSPMSKHLKAPYCFLKIRKLRMRDGPWSRSHRVARHLCHSPQACTIRAWAQGGKCRRAKKKATARYDALMMRKAFPFFPVSSYGFGAYLGLESSWVQAQHSTADEMSGPCYRKRRGVQDLHLKMVNSVLPTLWIYSLYLNIFQNISYDQTWHGLQY